MLTAKSSSFLPRQQALYPTLSIAGYAALSACKAFSTEERRVPIRCKGGNGADALQTE
jgi:hypothetical protein